MQNAFHIVSAVTDIPLFIIGDHASNHIPSQYKALGLKGEDLTRHIAWDIGTETIIKTLCTHFGCAGQLAAVSRLVIDLNREPERDSLIPFESDGTHIPGNRNLTPRERNERLEAFYTPYHDAIDAQLDVMKTPLVLSIHSFTPQVRGQAPRMVDIGLLVRHDEPTAHKFKTAMEAAYNYDVRMNEPYSAYDLNYTVDHHLAPRCLRHLAIEIRQDHIDTQDKARRVAMQMAEIIAPLISL
ncbi:MAG: N-formylglutamate amidohydrolase [Litorimonas sp.]